MRIHALVATVLVVAPLSAQSPALDAAAAAMGGKERILAVRTLVLEGTGDNLNFGQNHTPDADTRFSVTAFRRSYDYVNRRWLLDQTRVPTFPTGNMNPQRQRIGLDGAPNGIAYNINVSDVMTRVGGRAAADRILEFLYHPIGFMIVASQEDGAVDEAGPGGSRIVRFTASGARLAMVIDRATSLPARIEHVTYHPMLGDVTLVTDLADWREVDGLRLPMRITQRYENLFTLSTYLVSNTVVNGDAGNLAATDEVRATPDAAVPAPAPTIAVDTLSPGLWLIAGQSHHTVAIEQAGQIVLVEAPQNDARTLAAIAAARTLRPGKAPRIVINTHHHFDHAGGFRAAVSQGLGVMTQRTNRDFFERVVFPRRHTLQQDALAQNPRPLRLTVVGDRHVMRDSLRTIEVYHVAGNSHNGGMLVVYLPAERTLIQADLYNPPPPNAAVMPAFPFVASLVNMVQQRGLQVEQVVGIHGRPVPFSDLQAAAAANRGQ